MGWGGVGGGVGGGGGGWRGWGRNWGQRGTLGCENKKKLKKY